MPHHAPHAQLLDLPDDDFDKLLDQVLEELHVYGIPVEPPGDSQSA